LQLSVEARGSGKLALESAETMHDADLHAVNSKEAPLRIAPIALKTVKLSGETLMAELPPASWTVIRMQS
jgi:alpha-L-arabinofuranosidase